MSAAVAMPPPHGTVTSKSLVAARKTSETGSPKFKLALLPVNSTGEVSAEAAYGPGANCVGAKFSMPDWMMIVPPSVAPANVSVPLLEIVITPLAD